MNKATRILIIKFLYFNQENKIIKIKYIILFRAGVIRRLNQPAPQGAYVSSAKPVLFLPVALIKLIRLMKTGTK
jgi:hypothetical protein